MSAVLLTAMKKNNAFTLIELLVVIAIIAILVAFLAPAVIKYLEAGRSREDSNNLKSIGSGIQMYLNDHNDSFFAIDASDDEVWPKALKKKYVPDWKAFRSPFDRVTTSRPKREEDPVPISYGLNANLMEEGKTFTGKWTSPQSALVMGAPAVDQSAGKVPSFRAEAVSTSNITITPFGQGGAFGTHQARESVNVLFCDGHVETMEWKKFSDSSSKLGAERWFPIVEE